MSLTCWDCEYCEEDLRDEDSTKGFCTELKEEVYMGYSVNMICKDKCVLKTYK